MSFNSQKIVLSSFVIMLFLIVGCSDEHNQSPTPLPEPELTHPDLTQQKLLTDEELLTPALSLEPAVAEAYQDWVSENHFKIRSIVYDQDFSDLEFLSNILDGKRIVQLGESSHGSREFNMMKVRLIKYMHQHLGYNVIVFESSLASCYLENKTIISNTQDNPKCIFGVWATEELRELFRYIRETHSSNRPLMLSGNDIQISGGVNEQEKTIQFVNQMLTDLKPEMVASSQQLLESYHLLMDWYISCLLNDVDCDQFNDNYLNVYDELIIRADSLSDYVEIAIDQSEQQQDQAILPQLFYSMALNTLSSADKLSQRYFIIRDRGMAENLKYLADYIYPNEKLIVWAHNSHIATDYPGEYLRSYGVKIMGMHLDEMFGNELFTIGLYMLRGESAFNNRSTAMVTALLDNSLESISYSLRTAAIYLPFNNVDDSSQGDDWQFQLTPTKIWGNSDENIVPADSYDGVIVIDKSSMPDYIN